MQSYLDLDVFSYARTEDGTISAIADSALTRDRRHHVPLFNAATASQTSRLRLINPGTETASIRIQAWDDAGQFAPNGDVRLSLPAEATRTLDAVDLQYGADGIDGSFGAGDGNWRLLVDADRDIHVMSLVTSTEGDLTNISSTSLVPRFLIECVGGSPDADNDGIADHCDDEPQTALRPLSACGDGTYVSLAGAGRRTGRRLPRVDRLCQLSGAKRRCAGAIMPCGSGGSGGSGALTIGRELSSSTTRHSCDGLENYTSEGATTSLEVWADRSRLGWPHSNTCGSWISPTTS